MKILMNIKVDNYQNYQLRQKQTVIFERNDYAFMQKGIQWFHQLNQIIADGNIPNTSLFNKLIDEIFITNGIVNQAIGDGKYRDLLDNSH